MDDENKVLPDDQKTPIDNSKSQKEVDETTENEGEELTPEQIADLKKKAEASSKNFERAKKAEEELKKFKGAKKEEGKEETTNLSPKDYLALQEAKVSSEDFDEVVRVAEILNKPIHEALKDRTMKSILDQRTEERRTAEATNTSKSSRTGSKDSGEEFLSKAERTGEVPDNEADMKKLAEARIARLRNKK